MGACGNRGRSSILRQGGARGAKVPTQARRIHPSMSREPAQSQNIGSIPGLLCPPQNSTLCYGAGRPCGRAIGIRAVNPETDVRERVSACLPAWIRRTARSAVRTGSCRAGFDCHHAAYVRTSGLGPLRSGRQWPRSLKRSIVPGAVDSRHSLRSFGTCCGTSGGSGRNSKPALDPSPDLAAAPFQANRLT